MQTNKEYKFMWGQKQSAMIAEAMMHEMKHVLDVDCSIKETDLEFINIMEDGTYANYMSTDAIERWKSNSRKSLNKEFIAKLFWNMDLFISQFFSFCDRIRYYDFKALTNKELKIILLQYQEFMNKALVYFETSTPQGTYLVEEEIKQILKNKIIDAEKVNECFIALSTPAEVDITMQERIDLYNIVKKKEITNEDIEEYSRRYPALFFNTYSREEILHFIKLRIDEKKNDIEIIDEPSKVENNLRKIKRQHNEIYNLFDDNAGLQSQLQYYACVLQKTGLYRYRLKHVWSGAEYLCLNLFLELSRRINISFSDFINTYMFKEIIIYLDNDVKMSDEEITARKKCFVIHHMPTVIYSGDKALEYKNQFLKKDDGIEKKIKIINGMTANTGRVIAKARIINVSNLIQFTQDCRQFQKGEILVTTMTSPIMVPLIEKASGIITDEGGICSHASIISREFGIPCIVGTQGASFVIKTGDMIELDAEKATITIINDKEQQSSIENTSEKKYVFQLNEIGYKDLAKIGGKAASLGELFHIMSVPEGFCITIEAYKEALEKYSAEFIQLLEKRRTGDLEELEKISQTIKQKIINVELPQEIETEIRGNYDKLGGKVAVRSSAIGEDGNGSSFAGQQDTFLNIGGEDAVIAAVKKCWASLFNSRAIHYREKNNFKHEEVFIAVVVQKMVEADIAGVIFTANPINKSADEIIIEACFGLGEKLVSGELTPDTFVIDKSSSLVKQEFLHFEKRTLTEEQLKRLAALAIKIEAYYKKPVDIEWAIEKDKIFILQARPITTLK